MWEFVTFIDEQAAILNAVGGVQPRAASREKNMMNNDKMVVTWQRKILMDCERILQRPLTDAETSVVRDRAGFIALELIEGSVSQMNAAELVEYLNSDRDD